MLLKKSHGGSTSSIPPVDILNNQGIAVDELAIFGGQTRILFSKMLLQQPPVRFSKVKPAVPNTSLEPLNPSGDTGTPISSADFIPPPSIDEKDTSMPDVHPSLMDYMARLSSNIAACEGAANSYFLGQTNGNRIVEPPQFPEDSMGSSFIGEQFPTSYQGQAQPFVADPTLFFGQFYADAASSNTGGDAFNDDTATVNDFNVISNVEDPWMRLVQEWNGATYPDTSDMSHSMPYY